MRARHGGAWAAIAVALGASVSGAFGQQAAGRPVASALLTPLGAPGAGNPFADPLASPYGNPYLNPYLNGSVPPDLALGAILTARNARGALGSGVISGTRPAPGAAQPTGRAARSRALPGEGAERYFGRAPDRPAGNRYFRNATGRFDR
jgi:hypothetical protein